MIVMSIYILLAVPCAILQLLRTTKLCIENKKIFSKFHPLFYPLYPDPSRFIASWRYYFVFSDPKGHIVCYVK
uniref:Secreted protein n=1 Tax=Pararge aegeria TaxID=116150 RepID=S4P909_9NEOP